ncbi:MAG: hypothetical protein AAGB48_12120 [Planctomycetota bacterium]
MRNTRMTYEARFWVLAGTQSLTCAAAAALVGCAASGVPPEPPRSDGPTSRTVLADWNDLAAAVSRASSRQAVAPLGSMPEEQPAAHIDLLSIDGQSVTVHFEAQQPWTHASGPVPITITATFGEPSDDARGAALVAQIAGSLEALAGRGHDASGR